MKNFNYLCRFANMKDLAFHIFAEDVNLGQRIIAND
jgi:hypothetical protein